MSFKSEWDLDLQRRGVDIEKVKQEEKLKLEK